MTKAVNVRTFKGEGDAPNNALNVKVFGGSGGGSGGSGSIRVLKIEYPTPENPTLNASYNDLVGMAEAGEVAVIFYNNVPLILSYLIQEGETVEETIYTANFKSLDVAAYTFTSYDANQPMPMV